MMNFPKIMGILNVTPDSFSDGGKYNSIDNALAYAKQMIDNGVDIIDIGGESTRPGAKSVSINEEIERVIPIIQEIKKNFPDTTLSIDTTKSEVALVAIKNGVDIVNDISGLQFDNKIAEYVAKFDKTLILMHIKGVPRSMQNNPVYENCTKEVYEFLENKIAIAKNIGVKKLIADIGIGFGKTFEHNWELLRNLKQFEKLNVPLALGISRKAFIGGLFSIDNAEDRDIETAFIHSLLLKNKVDIIRVHNVAIHNQLRIAYNALA